MAYRSNPVLPGWQALGPGELRLTDARIYATAHISPSAVAWYKRPVVDRPPMVVVVLRGAEDDLPNTDPTPGEVLAAASVVSAVLKWAMTKGRPRLVVAGYDIGARIAKAVVGSLQIPSGAWLNVVTFGQGSGLSVPDHVRSCDVVAPSGVRLRRAEGYLANIRSLYESGELAEILGLNHLHTVIRLSDRA